MIVYGLEESSTSSDTDKVKGVFQFLGEAPVLSKVERLGKGGNGVRPVRVVLRTRETAGTLLSRSARLKDSEEYCSVFISPDRTIEERKERRELVAKLKAKRETDPDKTWVIRRGDVIVKSE